MNPQIIVAGVDEVGRGPLVGSVVAAACVLPESYDLKGLTDSKKVSEKKRALLAEEISRRYRFSLNMFWWMVISFQSGVIQPRQL